MLTVRAAVIAICLAVPVGLASAQTAPDQTVPDPTRPDQTVPNQTTAAAGDGAFRAAVVTLDQERLLKESRFGAALAMAFEKDTQALVTENRKIDADLEAEERALTEKRKTTPLAEFRLLADAFDRKANELRDAQEAKSRELGRRRDADRNWFFQNIAPILGEYMVERGAVAILDKGAVVVSLGSIDITDGAIQRIDEKLGDGSGLSAMPDAKTQP